MRNGDAQHRYFGDGEVCAPHIKCDLRSVDGDELMYASNRNRGLTGLLLYLILLWWAPPSLAFVYRAARFETSSSNGKFVASVLAARGQVKRPILELFKVEDGKRTSQWKIELVNKDSPYGLLITDDGQFIVTLDEFPQMGIGNAVVAIYTRAGLIKSYSFEDFVGEDARRVLRDLLDRRGWRGDSTMLFDGIGAEARFGIWLPLVERWYVWKLADGSIEKLDPAGLKKWNEIGRRQVLPLLEAHVSASDEERRDWKKRSAKVAACKLLGCAKNPADRKLLEKLLEDDEPQLRMAADYALALLDGGAWKLLDEQKRDLLNFGPDSEWFGHYRLGGARVVVRLPERRPIKDLNVSYYLFPESVKADAWRNTVPIVRHALDPFDDFEEKVVVFPMNSLKPGRYWLKVVWYRTGLHRWQTVDREKEKLLMPIPPSAGDFETAGGEIFEIKPGNVIEVNLNCDIPTAKR